jgi:cell division protein ZipA
VLEITLIAIFLFGAFIAVAWYAKYRTTKAREELLLDDQPYRDLDEDEFAAILEEEIHQQHLNQVSSIDDDPEVSFSTDIHVEEEVIPPIETSDLESPTQQQPQQKNEFTEPKQQQEWQMSLVFTVMAKPDKFLDGLEIQRVLEQLDMQFGEMQLFHRYLVSSQKQVLFSAANVVEPGTLVPDQFDLLQTPGLLLFANLPGPLNGLLLFDEILDAANQLAEQLDGVICNDQREPMTQKDIEAMRTKILNFNMSMQSESDF